MKDIRAFPTYHGGYAKCDADGMTLRDYFAAKAIPNLIKLYSHGEADPLDYVDGIAKDAYVIADAMLKAREA